MDIDVSRQSSTSDENQIMGLYAQFTREGARLLYEETPSVRGINYRLFMSYVTVYLRSRRDHYRPALNIICQTERVDGLTGHRKVLPAELSSMARSLNDELGKVVTECVT